jgi:hypothetical protein
MAEHLPSRLAVVLTSPVADLGALVAQARAAGTIDRASPFAGDAQAWEVYWEGRMERAVVRLLVDEQDGALLLRTEASIGGDGPIGGMARHARLLLALVRALDAAHVSEVRDLSARTEHEASWLERVASGAVHPDDAVRIVVAGDGDGDGAGAVRWIHTHGAARFGVPDLELYALPVGAPVERGEEAVRTVMGQLLAGGLGAVLTLPSGTRVRLIPVLEAWARLPLGLSGVGRAGVDRGPGLDGPRATLSVHHRPRLGRHRIDLDGVIAALQAPSAPGVAG